MVLTNNRRTRWSLSIVGVASMFAVWYAVTVLFELVSPAVLPAPARVYAEFTRTQELIIANVWPTVSAGFLGLTIAVVLAVIGAFVLTLDDRIRSALMPLVVGGNSVPRVSLAPLIIFYFGTGVGANYVIAAWIAFFPMFLNALDGFSRMRDDYQELLSMYNASIWQEYRYVRGPNALPQIFDGVKVAVILAMIGAVVGEFVAADEGLGYLALFAMRNVNVGLVFAIVGIMGIISTASIFLLYLLQDRIVFWQESNFFTAEM